MAKLSRVIWCYLNVVLLLLITPAKLTDGEWSQVVSQDNVQPITPPPFFSTSCFTEQGMAVVMAVLGLFILFYFTAWTMLSYCCDPVDGATASKTSEEIEYMMINCNDEVDHLFEYYVYFSVGCPTPNFDMNNGWIEFALLTKGDKPIGIPVRFACSTLTDRTFSQFLLVLGRMTPMPDIVGIRASHNQAHDAFIYLYKYCLFDVEQELIETRPIREYIKREPTTFRPLNSDDHPDNFDYTTIFPVLPRVEWTSTIDILWAACPLLLCLSAFVMVAEEWNMYPDGLAQQDGSLYRSLFNVVYSLPLTGLLLIGIIAGKKYTINLKIQHSALSSDPNADYWWRVANMIAIVLCVLQIVLSSAVLLCGSYLLLAVNALYWFFSVVIVWVCAIGLWSSLESSIHVRYWLEGDSALDHELAEWYSRNNVYAANKDGPTYLPNSKETIPQVRYFAPTTTANSKQKNHHINLKTVLFSSLSAHTASNIQTITLSAIGPKFCSPKQPFHWLHQGRLGRRPAPPHPSPLKYTTKIQKQSNKKVPIAGKVAAPVPKRSTSSDDHKQKAKRGHSNVIRGKIKRKMKMHSTTKFRSLNKVNNKRTKASSLKVNRSIRAKVVNHGVSRK